MKKVSISLERSPEDMCCKPIGVEPLYPCVHLVWDKPYDLPDEGVITVTFKKKREERDVKDEKYMLDLELVEITGVESTEVKPPARSLDEAGDALDKLRAEQEDDYEAED